MTFDEFMRMTREQDLAADAKLKAYDPDSQKYEDVTGIVVKPSGDVWIRTDDKD